MAVSFLKKGADAQKVLVAEQAAQDLRDKDKGAFRFWIPKGAETSVTFLDGDLDENGLLDIPVFYEHNLKLNGKWGNLFVCTRDSEPCPLCETGNTPSCCAALTVIDHSSYVSKKDNKTYADNVKLMIIKSGTRKDLQRLAVKRQGLTGCTFDVSRKNEDKSPAVGDLFDFSQKLSPEDLEAKWGDKSKPLDYAKEIVYMEADEITKLLGMDSSPAMASSANTPTFNDNDL